MQINPLLLILFPFFFSLVSQEFRAQTKVDKDFYLIDSLVLEELFAPDKELLDSCLKLYHRSVYDTVKIAALGHICEHMEHKIWIKYQYLLLGIIEQKMVHSPDNLFLKESFSDALNNLGYINLTYKHDFSKAITHGKQALAIRQKINKPEKVAETIGLIGSSYVNQGNMLQGEEYISKSLSIQRKVGNLRGEAFALGNMIGMYLAKGESLKILKYAIRRVKIFKKLNDQRGIADALGECGLYYTELGDTAKALKYCLEALNVAESYGEKKSIGKALNDVGSCYWKRGDLKKASEFFQKSIAVYKISGDDVPTYIKVNLGQFYSSMGDQPKALKYFMEGLETSRTNNEMISAINPLSKIGTIYLNQGDTSKAFKYYTKALKVSRRLGNWKAEATILNALGNAYQVKNELTKSMESYKSALVLFKNIEDTGGMAVVLHNIGTIYEKKNHIGDALGSYEESLDLYGRNNGKSEMTQLFATLARVYMEHGRLGKALIYGQQGFELAKKTGRPNQVHVTAKVLYQIYKKQNENKKALEMHVLYTQMKDSIDGFEVQQVLDKMDFRRSLEKKDQRIKLMKKEKEVKKKQFVNTLLIYSMIVGLLILIGILLFRARKKRYENELNLLRKLRTEEIEKKSKETKSFIQITTGKKIVSLKLEDIIAFKANGNYIFSITKSGQFHIVDFTLNLLEEKLPSHFKRVHRSHIINTQKVRDIIKLYRGRVEFIMDDDKNTRFNSTYSYAEQVKEILNELRPSNV